MTLKNYRYLTLGAVALTGVLDFYGLAFLSIAVYLILLELDEC